MYQCNIEDNHFSQLKVGPFFCGSCTKLVKWQSQISSFPLTDFDLYCHIQEAKSCPMMGKRKHFLSCPHLYLCILTKLDLNWVVKIDFKCGLNQHQTRCSQYIQMEWWWVYLLHCLCPSRSLPRPWTKFWMSRSCIFSLVQFLHCFWWSEKTQYCLHQFLGIIQCISK